MKRLILKKEIIFAILLFGIFLILSGTAITLTNYFSTKTTTPIIENKIDKEESISMMKRIIKTMNNPYLPDEYYGYFYKKDSYKIEDIKDEVKIYLAIMEIYNNDMNFYNHIANKKKGTIEIPSSEVEEQISKIFGPNIAYNNVNLTGKKCNYFTFKYSKKRKSYISEPLTCPKTSTRNIVTYDEITSTEKEITFTQKLLIYENKKLYLDFNSEIEIPEENKTNLNMYDSQMLKYKFILSKNKDENYYLTKIELSK